MGNATSSIWDEIWSLKRAVGIFTGAGRAPRVIPPRDFTVTPGFRSLVCKWSNDSNGAFPHTEVWLSTTENREDAGRVTRSQTEGYTIWDLDVARVYWVWIRGVLLSPNIEVLNKYSDWVGPQSAMTLGIQFDDFPEPIIQDSILDPILREKIEDIPSLRDDVNELINYDIPKVKLDLDGLIDLDIPKIKVDVTDLVTNVVPSLNDDIVELREDVLNVQIPDSLGRLKGYVDEIHKTAMEGVNKASEGAVEALLNLKEVGDVLRDAGMYADPATGEVKLWALEQLRTETGVQLSNVEQILSAQDAKITQRATFADVDERIAGMVYGDVGELLLSGVDQRINEVELELDAKASSASLSALATDVTAHGGRIGSAEIAISGLQSDIVLKATNTEVSELGSKITTAESKIDALNGRISDEVVAIGQSSRNVNDLLAQAVVDDILSSDEARKELNIQIAVARSELSAKIDEGISAEAEQRTLLAAIVQDHYAFFTNETKVIADQTQSLARTMTEWEANFEGAATAVVREVVESYADENLATAESLTTLGTEFGEAVAGLQEKLNAVSSEGKASSERSTEMVAAIMRPVAETAVDALLDAEEDRKYATEQFAMIRTDYATRIEEGLFSEATKREQLGAVLDDEIYNRQAAIQSEQKARTDAVGAVASKVDTIQATIENKDTGLSSKASIEMVQNVFSGENEAWSTARNTLKAEVIGDAEEGTGLVGIIQDTDKARATDTEAIVERLDRQVAAVTRPVAETAVDAILDAEEQAKREAVQYAAIFTEATTRIEEGILSEATKREQLESKLDDSLSIIRTEQRTYTDNKVGAETELRTNLEARYGETAAKVQEHSQAIAGIDGNLEAMWTLKVDAGKVAGIGLYADQDVSEFTIHADKFFMYSDGNGPSDELDSRQVFSVADNELVFNGDIFARTADGGDGIITGGKIRGDKIYADSKIQLGNPMAILLDGSTGRLTIADPENPATGEFLQMDRGKLETYFYANGSHHMVKNLRRMETGVAANNTTVTLPGYWPSMPKVFVTPRTIQTYSKDHSAQSQSVDFAATNITWNSSTKIAKFKPLARLIIVAGATANAPMITVYRGYHDGMKTLPMTMETDTYTVPPNVDTITIKCATYAQKFQGGSMPKGYYGKLRVVVKAIVSGSGGGTFTLGTVVIPEKEVDVKYYPSSNVVTVEGNVSFAKSGSSRTVKLSFTVEWMGDNFTISPYHIEWNIDQFTGAWGRFTEISYTAAGATIIGEGDLNYIAIGE